MEAAFLLLPIIGGYVFSRFWIVTKYQTIRETGHALYFRAAFYGILFSFLAIPLRIVILKYLPEYGQLEHYFLSAQYNQPSPSLQASLIGVTIGAFVLGTTVWIPLNWLVLPSQRVKIFQNALKENDVDRLLFDTILESKPVMISLENGKVYVGFCLTTVNTWANRKTTVALLPMVSGFRDPKTHTLTFTTDYLTFFEALDADQPDGEDPMFSGEFEVVLPVERIVSVQRFDLEAYDRFNQEELDADEEEAEQEQGEPEKA